MNPKLKKFLQYSFFLGIGIFLTYWQYNKMTEPQRLYFAKSIKEANYVFLIPVILISIISHLSRSLRWRYLIQPMGYNPLLSNTFSTVMIGYLVNLLAPRAGEVAKCTLLGNREKIPIDKLIGTVLVERAIDLLCYFLLIIITVALQYNRIKDFVAGKFSDSVANSRIHPLLKFAIFIVIVTLLIYIFKAIINKYKQNKIVIKINKIFVGVKDGFASIKKLEKKKLFWFQTLVIWASYLMQIYIGFRAMEFTSQLGIDAACGVLTLGTLAMILTPGGIGSFPIAVAEVLVIYNIAEEAALSFGWVIWGVSEGIVVILGILCFIWWEVFKNKNYASQKLYTK